MTNEPLPPVSGAVPLAFAVEVAIEADVFRSGVRL